MEDGGKILKEGRAGVNSKRARIQHQHQNMSGGE